MENCELYNPIFVVLTGPIGIGKKIIFSKMRALKLPLFFLNNSTTCESAASNKPSDDFIFYSREDFEKIIATGDFLDLSIINGEYYGLLKSSVSAALNSGKDIVYVTNVKCAMTLKKMYPNILTIFITINNEQQLLNQLISQKDKFPQNIEYVINIAIQQMKEINKFDYYVQNLNIEDALNKVLSIIDCEHHKIGRGLASAKRPLVFLCYAKEDRRKILKLYYDLQKRGINPWLDEIDILPGQDWSFEIAQTIRKSDYFIVCLSNNAINKRGYFQKEIRLALDEMELMPEGKIFLIPIRLEECIVPMRIASRQWVDLFSPNGFDKLFDSLK